MSAVVNHDEKIGKTVGRRTRPNPLAIGPADTKEAKRAWQRAFPLRVPKGVYRFRTHEEADAWLTKYLTQPAS